jgi:hypothetical protein
MKYLFLSALFALLLPLTVSAVVKIDIDGQEMGIAIKEGPASDGLRPSHPGWAKPPENYLIFAVSRRAPAEWTAYQCSFTPDADGEVEISRRGLSSKPDINHWVLYRNFKITGAEVKLHRVANVNTLALEPGVERAGHHHGIKDHVMVKAGETVTIEFEAKSGGTEEASKYSKEDYQLPPKPASKLKALQVVVDGTAAGIIPKPADGLKIFQAEAAVRNKKTLLGCILFTTPRRVGDSWARYEITFTPDLGGDIVIRRQSLSIDYQTLDWIEFRNFKLTGAELRHHITAPVNAAAEPEIERGAYRAPIYDVIIVKPGEPVKFEFEARAVDSEPYAKYSRQDYWRKPLEYRIDWQDKTIQLLGPEAKGAPFSIHESTLKFTDHPQAVFRQPQGPAATLPAVSVPVEIVEEDGISRIAEVRFGFPLPEKAFHEVGSLRVLSPGGQEIPAQFAALGLWGDQSVKWALVGFTASLKAGEKAIYRIEAGKGVKPATVKSSLAVAEQENGYIVSTGRLSCRINRNSSALVEAITINGKEFGSLLPTVIAETGNPAAAKPLRITIEEQGPVAATFRIDGEFKGDRACGGYTARLRFFADSPVIKLAFTYRADNLSNEFNDLNALSLNLTCGAGKLANGVSRIFQPDDTAYLVDTTTKQGFMPNTETFLSPSGKITFGLTDAGKRYPKAFAASPDGLEIQLLPEQGTKDFNSHLPGYLRFPYCSGKYRMMTGMNFTEDLVLNFEGAPVSANELIPVVDRAWYAKTGAIPGVSPDNLYESFDTKAIEAFYAHLERKKLQREYGFLNWGDWFGERGGNWGNNEYDFAYGLFTLFIRTGNRDVYRLAMAAARHQSDVDIIV